MELSFDREYTFIPEWNGNKSDPAPIEFTLKYLNTFEREKCMKTEFVSSGNDVNTKVSADRESFFTYAVTGIKNLKVNGVMIKTVKEFLGLQRVNDLFNEVTEFIITEERRGQELIKN